MNRGGLRLYVLTVFAALTSLASLAVHPESQPVLDASAAAHLADSLADGLAEAFRSDI